MRTDGKVLGSQLFHYVCHSFFRVECSVFVSDCILHKYSDRYLQVLYVKINNNFEHQIVNIFLSISFYICFGYSKEPSHWDGSFEYQQHMFWMIIMHPYTKPGFNG